MTPLRLVVAAASPVLRARLSRALLGQPGVAVLAEAANLSEAFVAVERLAPDLALVSAHLAALPEFDGMRALFAALDARWVEVEEPGGATDRATAARSALNRPTPAATVSSAMPPEALAARLRTAMATDAAAVAAGGLGRRRVGAVEARGGASDRLVLIGASTGGVDALIEVLAAFPPGCPPTAVVLHTGRGFAQSLVQCLARATPNRVVEARGGVPMARGQICVAAGSDGHLRLAGPRGLGCAVAAGEPIAGHMPSVDALFASAVPHAPRVAAALLTGMGRDGAAGLLALRRAGAATFGQDASSSLVYGMPRAAFEMGAVGRQLPLGAIARALLGEAGTG